MVWLSPGTRFNNKTKDSMVLTMEHDYGIGDGSSDQERLVLYRKRIKSEGSFELNRRKGFGRGLPVSFWVLPENRDGLRAHPNPILPADVFDSAEIDISYKSSDGSVTDNYQAGATMHFDPKRGGTIRRIKLVRYVTDLYDSMKTPFGNCRFAAHLIVQLVGNCCFAAHVPSEGDAAGHASAPTNQAPGPLAPAPALDVELATNNSHVPNLGVTAGHASGLGVAPDPAPLVVRDAPGPVTAPTQAPPALEGAPGPDHIVAPPALGEGPSSASAPGPSTSLNMVEALGQACPALGEAPGQALYPTEAITPAPALHVVIDIPSAAQIAAPATPSEILVTN